MSSVFQEKTVSILVVDDDLRMRESLRELLAIYEMNCTLAADGQQALKYLTNKHFDLVLLDIEMPKINGFKVMSEISVSYPEIDIIILSGKASFENARRALCFGAKDFLNKPYDPAELIELIHKLSEKRHLKALNAGITLLNKIPEGVDRTLMELEHIIHSEDLTFTNEIINSSPVVAFLWKNISHWPVQFVSENVVQLLGYTANEFMTQKIIYKDIIHPDDVERVTNEVSQNNKTKRLKHKSYRVITKFGVVKWVDDSSSTVLDEYGNITHYQGIIIDVTKRELAKQKMLQNQMSLEHVAYHDALTGLPNRLLLLDRLQQSIKKAKRAKKHLAVFYIDLDKFKPINDTLGHAAGDEVLKVVAQRLSNNVRAVDTVARIGGDEFIILMESVSDIHAVKSMAQKLNQSITQSIRWEMQELCVTSSIGISLSPDNGDTVDDHIKKADTAMYQSKVNGGNTFHFYQHT